MRKILRKTVSTALLTVTGCVLAVQANACDRACVIDQVNDYVSALVAHYPSKLDLADTVRSTQNGEVTDVGEGVWRTITEQGGYRQIFVDSRLDSATFFGAFKEGDDPLLMTIRFGFNDGKIVELEHLLSRPDRRNRLVTRHQLTEPNPVYDEVVPTAKRLSRDQLIAAAHAYFDGIANSSDAGVPMHPECNRRENGVLLLRNPEPQNQPCPIGFHRFNYITDIRDRRVAVVDEARNIVLMFAFFDVPGNVEVAPGPWGPSDLNADGEPRIDTRKIPRSLYIAELFHLVDGKIRDIEAVMYNLDLGTKAGWE